MSTVVSRGLPWAAVAAGLVVLAVGVGLGPRHYAASGLSGTALLGFALAAVGLVVAAWAGLRVLRGTRRRWWLVTAPGPPAPPCSTRPPCSPGTATACCSTTRAATATAPARAWTSAGGASRTQRALSTS